MKAIYAFYSKPFGGGDIRKASTHWSIPYVEFLVMAYSVSKSKEYGFETVLFCDRYGKELILDTFGIKFDIVKVELVDCELYPKFWAAGKIYAYSKGIESLGGFEPFVMFDNDAGFHKQPPAHFMASKYRCQSIHIDAGTIFQKQYDRILKETKNEFPFDIFHEFKDNNDGVRGGNAGMVVINDERLWAEFTRYTWALMESDIFTKIRRENTKELNSYKVMSMWNVLIEENLMYFLNKRLNLEAPQTVFEFNGFSAPMNLHNPTGYFHIWGSKKNVNFLKKYEQIAVSYIDKQITEKVYKYFNVKWQ